ncbi:MAG: hypothetical protein ABI372_08495 [Ginsengibacter sp.]
MEINRNNYENYFLLYADNELSQTEKKVVEIFVQENIDLKEEFIMITLTVSSPDKKVALADKSFLLHEEPAFINENNFEEIFVLYFDNELSVLERTAVEKFVTENKNYKTDFEVLENTKLFPDNSIAYPHKNKLYRKGRFGKTIPLMVWKYAAAAVFIGFGLWFGISQFNHTPKSIPLVLQKNHINEPSTKPKNTIPDKPLKEENDIASSAKIIKSKKINRVETDLIKPLDKQNITNDLTVIRPASKIKKSTTKDVINNLIPDVETKTAALTLPIKSVPDVVNNQNKQVTENEIVQEINNNEANIPGIKTQPISYVMDVSSPDQNFVFYDVSAEEFKRSKVGGFLKKVKRIVERNNPITRIFTGDEGQFAAN